MDICYELGFIALGILFFFPGDKGEVFWPWGTFFDPGFEEVCGCLRKRAALLFWGHEFLVVRVEDGSGVEGAFVGFTGNEGGAAIT